MPRYTGRAGWNAAAFDANHVDVVEQYPERANGLLGHLKLARFDRQGMSADELERELILMRACWAFFDEVRGGCRPRCRRGRGEADRDQSSGYVCLR